MPPKKFSNFFYNRKSKKSENEESKNKPNQSTLSKFFSFQSKRTADDSHSNNEQNPVPAKRSRADDETAVAGFADNGKKEVHLMRMREKLQSFSARPDTDETPKDYSHFDFTILKRQKAASLPDINLEENCLKNLNECDTLINDIDIGGGDSDIDIKKLDESKQEDLTRSSNLTNSAAANGEKLLGDNFAFTKKTNKESKSKSGKVVGKLKYTQLEQQYLEIKEKYPDAVLFVECGYKYRFFGDDAEVAAKILKIYCHLDHNFMTASIPNHRLYVHVRRLVTAGYKVGVVKQTETAALKAAGSNRNAPFTRQLSALYTKSTFISEDVDTAADATSHNTVSTATSYLMCLCDHVQEKNNRHTQIGILAVQPSTGDIIYDSFEDSDSRTELETRLAHIQPVEVILSHSASEYTTRLIQSLTAVSHMADDRMRVEKVDATKFEYGTAFRHVTDFYSKDTAQSGSSSLQDIVNLPGPVIVCLSVLINYLQDFSLDKIMLQVSNFHQFTTKDQYMQLGANTLRNLEIFRNSTDGQELGSLYWALNHTVTRPGARLLRQWISQPLLSVIGIQERQSAITDILDGLIPSLPRLKGLLSRLPDLERALSAVYHKKCKPAEFVSMCEALTEVSEMINTLGQGVVDNVTSPLLREIVTQVPELLSDIATITAGLDKVAARKNDKSQLFVDETAYPPISECKEEMKRVLQEIQDHRRHVRLTVRQPALEYVTVLGTEFLVEVKNANLSLVPQDWTKISSTKTVGRFHSPFIAEKYKLLQQLREQLVIEGNKAWLVFLEQFVVKYQGYRRAVMYVSQLDCLLSLATVAQQHGYCRPVVVEDKVCIEVEGGCHPVIQRLLAADQQYVANDTHLDTNRERVMIITGPNMGGKSCYIRQVALLSILAQIGSYVPAETATFGLLDAIYIRMGAADEIYKGRSTFMVELQEASEIMSKVTSRSLVILDELGRGTSTHDGVAIAHATLQYFIMQPKCLTLFVTHYPSLAEMADTHPDCVANFHMAFLLNDQDMDSETTERVTFLYQLVRGRADRSYGLNVASLANIPADIVRVAAKKSRELESLLNHRREERELFFKIFGKNTDYIKDLSKS